MSTYSCNNNTRAQLVLDSADLNGVDYVEVLGPTGCGDQLAITFLKDATSLGLGPANINITGGAAVPVVSVAAPTPEAPNVVTVQLANTGDFSRYTLSLVAGQGQSGPPAGVDPVLSSAPFSFKAGCPTPTDCLPTNCCPATAPSPPDINYLAKDYGGFLQVVLDRLAVLTPDWTETHAADLGVALAEVLAYAADHLSYEQDAVTTEAYIGTARSRISLRRHARLLNYTVSEGCNARVLVLIVAAADGVVVPVGTLFYLTVPGLPAAGIENGALANQLALGDQPVFSAMQPATLYTAHNEMPFYTWGDSGCCLAPGATAATLAGNFPQLSVSDIVIFEEVLGPLTGQPEDANPANRCAVCLTSVTPSQDPLTGTDITQIAWAAEDALPFALCISAITQAGLPLSGVSVARGNVVPADHGTWINPIPDPSADQDLGTVPAPVVPVSSTTCNCGAIGPVTNPVPRFYPSLAQSPLTFCAAFSGVSSVASFLSPPPGTVITPAITVNSDDGSRWAPLEPDLLTCSPNGLYFVPEVEYDGTVYLRFGDGQYGMAPEQGVTFYANYRTGNGAVGNVGRDTMGHAVLPANWGGATTDISEVRNPLGATGGADPEDMDHIRQFAPFAYQTQLRCVTEADYGQMATQLSGGSAARGTMRWTGSWYTAFVSVDSTQLTTAAMTGLESGLRLYRMMGTDIAVEEAIIVGLEIEFQIYVDPAHFQGDVYDALMAIFVSGNQCDGAEGLLNPSNFSFGQTVYASPLIAAAQGVDGVASVVMTKFTRLDTPWLNGVAVGFITLGRLEIARCDNDPDHLDHGILVLDMSGGK